MTTTESILSIGKLCDQLGMRRDQVQAVAAQAGVKPTMTIDGVLFYAAEDVVKIGQHLQAREGR